MKEEQKKSLKKLESKGGSLASHKWCSYCQKYHPRVAFYKNSAKRDGLQVECKVVSMLRLPSYSGWSYSDVLNHLFKEDKKLYTSN